MTIILAILASVLLITIIILVQLIDKNFKLHNNYEKLEHDFSKEVYEKEDILNDKSNLEKKMDEKNFKFLAINQMAKTLSKEKNLFKLKTMIMDMFFEVNSIKRGFSLEKTEIGLKLFDERGMGFENRALYIDNEDNTEFWELLENNRIIPVVDLKKVKPFNKTLEDIEEGYGVVFYVRDENNISDIHFLILLGEKTYGTYGSGEIEFLDTLRGQVEIILENSLKQSFIETQNKKLTEKLYDLMMLNNSAKLISSTLNIEEIFKIAVDMFTEVSRATRGAVLYYNNLLEEFEVKTIRGDFEVDITRKKIKIESKEIEFLKKNPKVILISELRDYESPELFEFYNRHKDIFKNLKPEVFIPLVSNEELLGIVFLGIRISNEGYHDDHISLYSTLGNQIAIALYNAKLYTMAITDGLTQLFLHRYFMGRLNEEIERCRRYKRNMTLIMIDIDDFKNCNDTYGHLAGDEALRCVSSEIKKSIRKSDIACRYGGEEFAIILPETSLEGGIKVGEYLREKIEALEIKYNKLTLKITISIGITIYYPNEDNKFISKDELIRQADKSLYYSKDHGKNQVNVYKNIKEHLKDEN